MTPTCATPLEAYRNNPAAVRWLAMLLILTAVLFAFAVRSLPIYADESNYGPIAKCMLATGDWLTMRAGSECRPVFTKGPLFFLPLAASLKFGGITEAALRFPNLVASIGIVALTYHLVMVATKAPTVAFVSGLILLTTYQFTFHQRYAIADPLMMLLLMLGAVAHVHSLNKAGYAFVVGLVSVLAMLVKPLFPVVLLPIVLSHLVLTRRLDLLRRPFLYLGIVAGTVPFVLWNLYEYAQFGSTFIWEYWGIEAWGTGSVDAAILRPGERAFQWAGAITPQYYDHAYHWDTGWFYVMWLALFYQPWLAFLPRALAGTLRATKAQRPVGWIAAVWVVLLVSVLSGMRWRSQHYLLMVYPMLAVIIGVFALPRLVINHEGDRDRLTPWLLGGLVVIKVTQLAFAFRYPAVVLPAGWRFELLLTTMCIVMWSAVMLRRRLGSQTIIGAALAMWALTVLVYGSLIVRPQQRTDLAELRAHVATSNHPVVLYAPALWLSLWDENIFGWYFDGLKVCRTDSCLKGLAAEEPIVLSTESQGLEAFATDVATPIMRKSIPFKLDIGHLQVENEHIGRSGPVRTHYLHVFEYVSGRLP